MAPSPGRPKGSYKLSERIGDLVWDAQDVLAKGGITGRVNVSEVARLLKKHFPQKYGPMITETRLRQYLEREYLRKKSIDQIDAFNARVWARILGEE
jgi:hypothetical protein